MQSKNLGFLVQQEYYLKVIVPLITTNLITVFILSTDHFEFQNLKRILLPHYSAP